MPPTTSSTFVASTVSKIHGKFEDDKEEEDGEKTAPTTQTTTTLSSEATTPSGDTESSTSESSPYAGFPSYEDYIKDYERKFGQTDAPSSTTHSPTTVDKNNGLSIEEQSPLNPLLPTEAPQTTAQPSQEPVPGPEDESSKTKNEADTTSKAENRPQESKEEDEFSNLMSQLKNDFDLAINSTGSSTTTTTELPPIVSDLLQQLDKTADEPTNTIEQKLADANKEDIEATKYSTPSIVEDIKEEMNTITAPVDVFKNDDKEETKITTDESEESKAGTVWGFPNYDEYMKDYMMKLNDFYNVGNSSGSIDFNNKPTEIPAEPSPVPTTPSTAVTTPSASSKEDSEDEEERPEPPSFEGNIMEAPQDGQTSPQKLQDDTLPQGIIEDTGIPTQKPPTTSGPSVTSAVRPTTTPIFTITKDKESKPTGAYTIFTTSPAPTTHSKGVTSQKPDLQTQTAKTEDTNTPTDRPSVTSPVTAKAPPVTPQASTSPDWMEIEILPKTEGFDNDEATTSTTNAPTTTASKPASDTTNDDNPPITRPNDVTTRSQTSPKVSTPSDKDGTEETITQASMKATSSSSSDTQQATTPSTTTVATSSSTTTSKEAVVPTSESLLYDEEQKNHDSSHGAQSTSAPTTTESTTTTVATGEQTNSLSPNEDAVFITESSDKTSSSPTTTIQPDSTQSLSIDNNPVQTPPVETQPPPPDQYETTFYGFSSYEEYLSDFYKQIADAKQFQDTVLTTELPPSPETAKPAVTEEGLKEPEGIQGPAYPSAGPINPDITIPASTSTTTETPVNLPQDTYLPTEPPPTTAWPWNDLEYDYRYLWETYSQVLQKWANKYMAPVEHHNVTVWPNSHPTMSPNRTGIQSEYETYLGNFEKWEAKNRPYVPTTPKTASTPSMVQAESLPPVPPETTPVPSVVLLDHFQEQQQSLPEVTKDKPENSEHTFFSL